MFALRCLLSYKWLIMNLRYVRHAVRSIVDSTILVHLLLRVLLHDVVQTLYQD